MSLIDYGNFLTTLTLWLAARASLEASGTPRQLWAHSAIEGAFCSDPYTVLAIYGGNVPSVPTPTFSVQARTDGTAADAAMSQAGALFAALLNAAGEPLRMTAVGSSLRIQKLEPHQPPSLISRDDRGRVQVVFNFDVTLAPL